MPQITLTKAQWDWVEWALGAMPDFWCTSEGAEERLGENETDLKVYSEDDLPKLEGRVLTLSSVHEINTDLLYRLEVQAVDLAESHGRGHAVAAMRVATQMRALDPALGVLRYGAGWIDPPVAVE